MTKLVRFSNVGGSMMEDPDGPWVRLPEKSIARYRLVGTELVRHPEGQWVHVEALGIKGWVLDPAFQGKGWA